MWLHSLKVAQLLRSAACLHTNQSRSYLNHLVYAILACVREIETQDRPEKYISICSDSQVALKALQAAKTTSPLVQQCQQVLNDISTRHAVRLYWVPGHAGVRGNEITDKLAACKERFWSAIYWA